MTQRSGSGNSKGDGKREMGDKQSWRDANGKTFVAKNISSDGSDHVTPDSKLTLLSIARWAVGSGCGDRNWLGLGERKNRRLGVKPKALPDGGMGWGMGWDPLYQPHALWKPGHFCGVESDRL